MGVYKELVIKHKYYNYKSRVNGLVGVYKELGWETVEQLLSKVVRRTLMSDRKPHFSTLYNTL